MEGLSGPQEAGAWRFRRLALVAALIVFSSPSSCSALPPHTQTGGHRDRTRRRQPWPWRPASGTRARLSARPTPAGLDLFGITGTVRGAVQLAADHLGGRRARNPNRPRATSPSPWRSWRHRRAGHLPARPGDAAPTWPGWCWTASCSAARACSSPVSPLFPRILDNTDGSSAFSLVVPVIDIVIATVATLLFLRGRTAGPAHTGPGRRSAACVTRSPTSCYAVQFSQQGSYTFGSITDLGWIAGYALIALAARSPAAGRARSVSARSSRRRCGHGR